MREPRVDLIHPQDEPDDREPVGPGQLQGRSPGDGDVADFFPLRGLDVRARLSGPLALVEVVQTFGNTFSVPMEATYIFSLPAGAAVHRFRMRLAGRLVEGAVKERKEARQEYDRGLRQGHRAALLEQERDNVFTVQLGNIPPGEELTIELSYASRMERNLVETTFRFPLVVAPRYTPGSPLPRPPRGRGVGQDTRRVRDASRVTPPVLPPGLQTGASLNIRVEFEGEGLEPDHLACTQHAMTSSTQEGRLVVELSNGDELLNRDFLLRFRMAGHEAKALLLADPGHFLLTLIPPRKSLPGMPRDVVILLDRSGSMYGTKFQSASKAVADFLELLEPGDRFSLVTFSSDVQSFQKGRLQDVSKALQACEWLSGLQAGGGTEVLKPLQQVMKSPEERGRILCVVLITDGEVDNEHEVLRAAQQKNPHARLFTLGIDTAVNDAFLRRLAQIGRGTCELVTPGEKLEGALKRLASETGRPLLMDVDLHDRGLGITKDSLAPERAPDLFAARPCEVLGRKSGHGELEVTARRADGSSWSQRLAATPTDSPALPLVWARERVSDLEDRIRMREGEPKALEREILAIALEYGILTRFTAFVLVDRSEVVNRDGQRVEIVQPVELPAEWSPAKGGGRRSSGGGGGGGTIKVDLLPAERSSWSALELAKWFLEMGVEMVGTVIERVWCLVSRLLPPPRPEFLLKALRRDLASLRRGWRRRAREHLLTLLDVLATRVAPGSELAKLRNDGLYLARSLKKGEDVAARLERWIEAVEKALIARAAEGVNSELVV